MILVACGGDDSAPSDGGGAETKTEPTTQAADTEGDDVAESAGEYAVLILANVDQITAEGALSTLEEAGFEGFEMQGSAEEGFDVFKGGFDLNEANELAAEIKEATGMPSPMAWEADNLP